MMLVHALIPKKNADLVVIERTLMRKVAKLTVVMESVKSLKEKVVLVVVLEVAVIVKNVIYPLVAWEMSAKEGIAYGVFVGIVRQD